MRLLEVFANELAGLAPRHTVDEIDFLLIAVAGLEIPIDSDGKGGDGNAAAGTPQLRIPSEAAHNNDMIKHDNSPPMCGQPQRTAHF